MSRRWVVNASPLILLGKIDHLHLLPALSDELLIPEGVAREVRVRPEGVTSLEALTSSASVRMTTCDAIPREVEVWDLGVGESEVLAMALANRGCRVVIDDLEARRCARAFGLGVVGTLGVVLRAKHQGLIPAARPTLDRLRRVGLYLADDLAERALRHVGEPA